VELARKWLWQFAEAQDFPEAQSPPLAFPWLVRHEPLFYNDLIDGILPGISTSH
jgi:hypothetical protein